MNATPYMTPRITRPLLEMAIGPNTEPIIREPAPPAHEETPVVEGEVTTIFVEDSLPPVFPVRPRRWTRWQRVVMSAWGVLTLLLLVILLVEHASSLLMLADTVGSWVSPHTATITIYPSQHFLDQHDTLRGIPDRTLAVTTPSQTVTVATTGISYTQPTPARGTVTLYNAAPYSQTVYAGTHIRGSDGIEVVTEQTMLLPAGNAPVFGVATVPAQTLQTGSPANIAPLDLNTPCCLTAVVAKNIAAFTGGADTRPYPMVATTDVTNAATPLSASLIQQAQAEVQTHIQPDERPVNAR